MSEKKVEKVTIDKIGVTDEQRKKAEAYSFNKEDFDAETESFFSMSASSIGDEQIYSKIEMMGNLNLTASAMVSAIKSNDRFRELFSVVHNQLMMSSIEEMSGKSIEELKKDMDEDLEKEGKCALDQGTVEKMPFNGPTTEA